MALASAPQANAPPRIPEAVGRLLAACFPHASRLACRQRAAGARSSVWMLEWDEPGGRRGSAVAKCPNHPDEASLAGLTREAQSLTFLGGLPDPELARIAPKLYGHDEATGVLLMEDLAASRGARRLHDLLQTSSSETCAEGLRVLARALGRLHRATFGRLTYASAAAAFDRAFERRLRAFTAKMRAYGLRLEPQAVAELAQIRGLLERREQISFCHGDVSPANVYVGPAGVALCDFEFAGPRHPMLEGIPAGAPFPFTVDAGALGSGAAAALESVYRRECDLAALCAPTVFETLRRAALVWFVVYHWAHSAPEAGVPVGFAGGRPKTLDLTRLLETAGRDAPFGAITRLLLAAGERLRAESALAPDVALPYACFDAAAPPGNGDEPPASEREAPLARILGLFRVSRHCHLVIEPLEADSVAVFMLECPSVQCTARRVAPRAFQANEMRLRLTVEQLGVSACDLRTGKTVALARVRWPWILVRRWRERLAIRNQRRRWTALRQSRSARRVLAQDGSGT